MIQKPQEISAKPISNQSAAKSMDVEDPNWMMLLPLVLFVILMFYFGLHSGPVVGALESITAVL